MSARSGLVGTNPPGPIWGHPRQFFPWTETKNKKCTKNRSLEGQAGNCFVSCRACVRCLCEVRSGWKCQSRHFPFFLFGPGGFPFSLCPPRSYPASAGFIGTFLYHGVFSDTIIHNILQYTRNEYKGYTLRYCTALYDTIMYYHLLYYTVFL